MKDMPSNMSGYIDTKSKIIISVISIFAIILSISFEQVIFFLLLGIILLFSYHANVFSVFKQILVPFPLIISLMIMAYFSHKSRIIGYSNVSYLYNNGELAIFYGLRTLAVIIISIIVISSESSFFEIIYALDELKLPQILINILLLMYRFVLDMQIEARRMIDARNSRIPDMRWGTKLYTYRIIGYMIAGIIGRAFMRKDTRYNSLISKGFNGKLHHKAKPFTFRGLFTLWLVCILNIIVLMYPSVHFLGIGVAV